ncbi:MAG: prepilin-type N-terminal cleavage/methylation domain-containing protein [Desulfosarcina sp.]|nr:prepilin-type N-terminal cleavage/methylation domain-containing protein [Desulfosarcina sp.]MBC2743351.1 prepilin-type N-terminal cleavage/methylation domain-containing protein [Desulfosarcina sp.]MBC2766261.1 prepilin-type N-terminal cleavage/methylation domain-containing protein [Desulfosarcina sp.]
MRPNTKDANGFTLLEMMIALAIGSIVMLGISSTYQSQLRSHMTQQSLVDLHQNARAAMHVMKKEIQMAGYDPSAGADATVLIATATDFQFQIDADGDGDCNDANEVIRYALSGGDLGRDTGSGLQPVAENIDAIDFVYYDDTMTALIPYPNNETERASIRLVQVTIVARADDPVMSFKHTNTDTYTNRIGTTIFGPVNDTSRRALMSASVWCRNMGM